jgi:hypothetical protein
MRFRNIQALGVPRARSILAMIAANGKIKSTQKPLGEFNKRHVTFVLALGSLSRSKNT